MKGRAEDGTSNLGLNTSPKSSFSFHKRSQSTQILPFVHKHHSDLLQRVRRLDSEDAQYNTSSVDANSHLKRGFQNDLELDSASLMMGKLFKLETKPEGSH